MKFPILTNFAICYSSKSSFDFSDCSHLIQIYSCPILFSIVLPQINPFSFGDDEMKLDDSVSATCTILRGDLPVKIWWTLSDSYESLSEYNISTNDGIVITKAGNKLSVLNIEAVKARHRGNYSCYAKNKAGVAKHSAYLAISG